MSQFNYSKVPKKNIAISLHLAERYVKASFGLNDHLQICDNQTEQLLVFSNVVVLILKGKGNS